MVNMIDTRTDMKSVFYSIDIETEKAVFAEVRSGWCSNSTKHLWIPKSQCIIENGYVVKVAWWVYKKIRILGL